MAHAPLQLRAVPAAPMRAARRVLQGPAALHRRRGARRHAADHPNPNPNPNPSRSPDPNPNLDPCPDPNPNQVRGDTQLRLTCERGTALSEGTAMQWE
eukprot:scaffold31889_cov64-Phaeocystis_antarctica.AAC.1